MTFLLLAGLGTIAGAYVYLLLTDHGGDVVDLEEFRRRRR